MKKLIAYIFFVLLVALYAPLTFRLSNDYKYPRQIGEICSEVVEPQEIYNTLSIKNLFVDIVSNGNTDVDDINWYYKNGSYILFLPKVANRNKIRVFFTIEKDVLVSAYDENNNLVGKFKSGDTVNVFKYDTLTLKTDNQTKKSKTYKVAVMQSEVGSVFINLNNGASDFRAINSSPSHRVTRSGYAMIVDDEDNITYDTLNMRGRGNATWKREKKPYQIKFDHKVDLYGMGKAKTYILLSNYFDGSLSRNYIFLKLGRDLNLPYSVEAEPVDVYINNNYHGSYLLSEKVQVKKNRIETGKDDFLFEVDNHESGKDYFKTKRGLIVTIKNPDFDELTAKQKAAVKKAARAYLNKIENAVYNTSLPTSELKKYIDFESFAKFYWVQELSINFDAFRGSNYFYVKDGILHAASVWDMDDTMNRSYYYASPVGYYVLDNARLQRRIDGNWYRKLLLRKDFSDEVDREYIDNRDVITSLVDGIDTYRESITNTSRMNYVRWNYSKMRSKQGGWAWLKGDYNATSSTNMFKKFLTSKINFYENVYKGLAYDYFIYSYKVGKYEVENIASDINKLPLNYTKDIKIYGVYNGTTTKLDQVKITEDETVVNLNYSKKASSRFKKFNRGNYKLTFKRED